MNTWNDGKYTRVYSGLRAYDALIEALGREQDYPIHDMNTLTFRAQVLTNDGIPWLEMKRRCASRFFNEMADLKLPGAGELLQAANLYQQEAQVLQQATNTMPLSYAPEPDRLKLADGKFREEMASYAREARMMEERAVLHLEQAFIRLGSPN